MKTGRALPTLRESNGDLRRDDGSGSEANALFRKLDRLELVIAVTGPRIIFRRFAAQMMDDAPHRVEAGLHRALDPARRPGHAIARHEDALLIGRHVPLHEVTIHAVVIAIMAGECALEGAEEIRVRLP